MTHAEAMERFGVDGRTRARPRAEDARSLHLAVGDPPGGRDGERGSPVPAARPSRGNASTTSRSRQARASGLVLGQAPVGPSRRLQFQCEEAPRRGDRRRGGRGALGERTATSSSSCRGEGDVADVLGTLRVRLARLISSCRYGLPLGDGLPLLEWHPVDRRWYAMHHPFTSPGRRTCRSHGHGPWKGHARAYDVVLNGMEARRRVYPDPRPDVQSKVLATLASVRRKRRRVRLPPRPFRFGAPPTAGSRSARPDADDPDALVVDPRRDRVPKTASGICLMTDSPGTGRGMPSSSSSA